MPSVAARSVPADDTDFPVVSPATEVTSSTRKHTDASRAAHTDDAATDSSIEFEPLESATILGPYELKQTLSRTPECRVRLAVHRDNNTFHEVRAYPLKQVQKNAKLRLSIERETVILRHMRHPYIVALNEVLYTNSHLYVVTEYCSGGELFEFLDDEAQRVGTDNIQPAAGEMPGPLPMAIVKRLFSELATAVSYLHSQGVAHRDIKLETVMLDANNKVKLGGFGSAGVAGSRVAPIPCEDESFGTVNASRETADSNPWADDADVGAGIQQHAVMRTGRSRERSTTKRRNSGSRSRSGSRTRPAVAHHSMLFDAPHGSRHYAAPEIVAGAGPYDGTRTDVWSCGVVLFALATGRLPFNGGTDAHLFESIRHGEFDPAAIPYFVALPPALKDLIGGMLTVDPAERLSISRVLEHAFWEPEPKALKKVAKVRPAAAPASAATSNTVSEATAASARDHRSAVGGAQQPRGGSTSRGSSGASAHATTAPAAPGGYAAMQQQRRRSSSGDRGAPVVERTVVRGTHAWV